MAKRMIEPKPKQKKVVRLKDAKVSKRAIAYMIDWYVGALFTAFPIGLFSLKLYKTMLHQDIINFPQPTGMIAGLIGLVFAIYYYYIVPAYIWKGQTFGKRVCHIRIVNEDDSEVSKKNLALRQLLGIFIVEGVLVSASSIWQQIIMILTNINIVQPLMYVGFAISGISVVLVIFKNNHRAIHDYIGKTRVVEGNAEKK